MFTVSLCDFPKTSALLCSRFIFTLFFFVCRLIITVEECFWRPFIEFWLVFCDYIEPLYWVVQSVLFHITFLFGRKHDNLMPSPKHATPTNSSSSPPCIRWFDFLFFSQSLPLWTANGSTQQYTRTLQRIPPIYSVCVRLTPEWADSAQPMSIAKRPPIRITEAFCISTILCTRFWQFWSLFRVRAGPTSCTG